MDNAIFISIQPRFASQIFQGTKTVELRRVRPKVEPGDIALVYVSSPEKSLYGSFIIERVVVSTPHQLWPKVKDCSGITKNEYDLYYRGSDIAVALHIDVRSVKTLERPIELECLRREWPEFQPPQSYRYLASILAQYNRVPACLRHLMPYHQRRSCRLSEHSQRAFWAM